MKIQIGNIPMNKTRAYLTPCLKTYGENFVNRYGGVFKVAIGIGDIVAIKSGVQFEKHIFILLESRTNPVSYNTFLKWVREQDFYEEDYAYDHISKGYLHMVVIKLPEECYNAHDNLLKGKFSEMYSPEAIKNFFENSSNAYKVLTKDHNYKLTFSKKLKEEYDIDLSPDDIDDKFEFEFPIKEIEEIFNTELS